MARHRSTERKENGMGMEAPAAALCLNVGRFGRSRAWKNSFFQDYGPNDWASRTDCDPLSRAKNLVCGCSIMMVKGSSATRLGQTGIDNVSGVGLPAGGVAWRLRTNDGQKGPLCGGMKDIGDDKNPFEEEKKSTPRCITGSLSWLV